MKRPLALVCVLIALSSVAFAFSFGHAGYRMWNKHDCKALIRNNDAYCKTGDCKALIRNNDAYCDSGDCKAYLRNNDAYCETKPCKAFIRNNDAYCGG